MEHHLGVSNLRFVTVLLAVIRCYPFGNNAPSICYHLEYCYDDSYRWENRQNRFCRL